MQTFCIFSELQNIIITASHFIVITINKVIHRNKFLYLSSSKCWLIDERKFTNSIKKNTKSNESFVRRCRPLVADDIHEQRCVDRQVEDSIECDVVSDAVVVVREPYGSPSILHNFILTKEWQGLSSSWLFIVHFWRLISISTNVNLRSTYVCFCHLLVIRMRKLARGRRTYTQ